MPERLERIMPRIEAKGGFTLRTIDMKDYDDEVKRFAELYNHFERVNSVYTPMTPPEIVQLAKDLKMAIDPDITLLRRGRGQARRRRLRPARHERRAQSRLRPTLSLRHLPPPRGAQAHPSHPRL
jgi:hypothetical protein